MSKVGKIIPVHNHKDGHTVELLLRPIDGGQFNLIARVVGSAPDAAPLFEADIDREDVLLIGKEFTASVNALPPPSAPEEAKPGEEEKSS